MPPNILLLGGDADHNLGDQAILSSMCRALRKLHPGATLAVVSADKSRSAQYADADILRPGLFGLPALCAAAARSDLVLVGGGGLFQDDDSLIKMPYWAARCLLMRLFCRRIIGYALGVGPLRAASSRLFARLAFACMEQVTVRDPHAQRVAQPATGKTVEVVPDPAILIEPATADATRRWLDEHGIAVNDKPLIGVAVRRWFPPRNRIVPQRVAAKVAPVVASPGRRSGALIDALVAVLEEAIDRHDAKILLLPTYNAGHEGDDRLCLEIQNRLPAGAAKVLHIDDPALYKGVAGQLALMLGGRMHPTIFAAAMATPIVGLAYNPKFHGFFELLDIPGRVMDVEAFVRQGKTKELAALIEQAFNDRDTLRQNSAALQERVDRFNRSLVT